MKIYKSYFLFTSILSCFLIFFLISLLFSCSKKSYAYLPEYRFSSKDHIPDYSKLEYWAAHPWKKDLSDSVPQPLRLHYAIDSSVDVFFIHPTTLTSGKDTNCNAVIDDPELNAKTDFSSILYQASAFNEYRVFAPRYRQAHYRNYFLSDSAAAPYFDLAYADVRAAFIYYLDHFNNGRPFIIASHSQGTNHAMRLLKEFVEGKNLYNRFVCAYLIGMPVPDTYYSTLQPCRDSASTGCFVSWRSFKSGYTGEDYIQKERFKAIVTNPLTWTSDTMYASSSLNKGGILLKFNKLVKHAVSAQVHGNILWTSKPNVFGKIFLVKKNYHVGDINLFYMNVRANARTRVGAFWKR